jgi:hypothetical protein
VTQVNEQLIRQITQQVMDAMARTAGPAAIHPPAGICTGDYSKFAELKNNAVGAPSPAAAAAPANSAPAPAPHIPVLFGIITAKQLEKLAGKVRLGPGARLTPLAADLVKQRKLVIERVDIKASSAAGAPAAVASDNWLWWMDGHCPIAEAVMQEFKDKFAPLATRRQNAALVEAVRSISRKVREGQAAGGVIFVHSAAQANCFANRCGNLRAVLGTSDLAVEQGVKLLGANVMIVEYPMHGHRSMRALVERFLQTPRSNQPDVEAQLRELGSCV